ncbi:hypothetical protein M3193_09510 [Sporosarcina luteola]|uniref:hypothetical protein n=1 Tax=Sporosarcina luteola TaxID=582850 RepID=UPI00203ECFC9|nr:hypothetical protein [Sporosarcina luteola]MCM3744379.1 hypothetical protein [Sporosarcina luteola]
MNYTTAKWLIGILATIAFVTIATVYVLDTNGGVPPLLVSLFKPIVLITLFPTALLIFGLMIARGKKEEKISTKSLGRSAVIIGAIFTFRWMTGYFD